MDLSGDGGQVVPEPEVQRDRDALGAGRRRGLDERGIARVRVNELAARAALLPQVQTERLEHLPDHDLIAGDAFLVRDRGEEFVVL